jgi:nitroimidazol reductase NimA-like FMN-containing flavoprotein (pyridoxamine 5'-phosphate oxidase superfamily)
MRRKEFEVQDRQLLEEVLRNAEIGYLAFNGADGWPGMTPLNFVFDGRILWHGAVAGERCRSLQVDPRATFVAVSLQTYIPSHFTAEDNAAAASVAFQSVQVRGRCATIEDPAEKCAILNRLMQKYQLEGRYKEISSEDPLYRKVLASTGVYALVVEGITGKFKLLQNKSEGERRKIAAILEGRGTPADLTLAKEILKNLKGREEPLQR